MILAKSEFMRNRHRTQFRDLNEVRNRVQGQGEVESMLDRGKFALMTTMQQVVDRPTWLGGYRKALAAGNDDERAIELADQMVIDSQGSGQTKDTAAIERGGSAYKLFTVFYSFRNTALNLGVVQTMTAKKKSKLMAD